MPEKKVYYDRDNDWGCSGFDRHDQGLTAYRG